MSRDDYVDMRDADKFLSEHIHYNSKACASNFLVPVQPCSVSNRFTALATILSPILNADHTRDRATSPPNSQCYPHTREKIIVKYMSWIKSTLRTSPCHVRWLYGFVGCGKSAIAQTIAERTAARGRLAASFFFFRASGDRSKTAKLPTTLAYQLSLSIPQTARHIRKAVENEPGLLKPGVVSIANRMRRLVYEPLSAAVSFPSSIWGRPFLILLDGLDECEDREQVEELLVGMLSFFRENPSAPLRFLITSRVEEHIRHHLQGSDVLLDSLSDYASRADIKTFLRALFDEEAGKSRVIQSYKEHTSTPWPSEEQMTQLVKHVNGSFIFASTFAKYIIGLPDRDSRLDGSALGEMRVVDDGLTPMERLELALNINPGLDGLYAHTLSRSSHFPLFYNIIAALTLWDEPLSIRSLALFLDAPEPKVIDVLVPLQAIIQVPGDNTTPVTFFHTSLLDFLKDPHRAGTLHVAPSSLEDLLSQVIARTEAAHPREDFAFVIAALGLWKFAAADVLGSSSRSIGTILESLFPIITGTHSILAISRPALQYLSSTTFSVPFQADEVFADVLARCQNLPLLNEILAFMRGPSQTNDDLIQWLPLLLDASVEVVTTTIANLSPVIVRHDGYAKAAHGFSDYLDDPARSRQFHLPSTTPHPLDPSFERFLARHEGQPYFRDTIVASFSWRTWIKEQHWERMLGLQEGENTLQDQVWRYIMPSSLHEFLADERRSHRFHVSQSSQDDVLCRFLQRFLEPWSHHKAVLSAVVESRTVGGYDGRGNHLRLFMDLPKKDEEGILECLRALFPFVRPVQHHQPINTLKDLKHAVFIDEWLVVFLGDKERSGRFHVCTAACGCSFDTGASVKVL